MRRALGAALIVSVALILGVPHEAEAKGPAWIVTGGELGERAVQLSWSDLKDLDAIEYVPGDGAAVVKQPVVTPSGGYVIYEWLGLAYVADRVHGLAPSFEFFPAERLLYDRHPDASEDVWRSVPVGSLELRIVEAAQRLMIEGEGWPSPIAAAAAASGFLSREGIQFRVVLPTWRDHSVVGTPGALVGEEAVAVGRAIVEVVSEPPVRSAKEVDASWIVHGTIWGSVVGRYAPPDRDQPGRFWPDTGSGDLDLGLPYYETSAEFDSLMRRSLEASAVHERALLQASAELRARMWSLKNERLARLQSETRERAALDFASAQPPAPTPRTVEVAAGAGSPALARGVALAALLAVVALGFTLRREFMRRRR